MQRGQREQVTAEVEVIAGATVEVGAEVQVEVAGAAAEVIVEAQVEVEVEAVVVAVDLIMIASPVQREKAETGVVRKLLISHAYYIIVSNRCIARCS